MHGDCAADHIKYNENGVVDCFVINFILPNNEWWKGNGKINDFVNVSYQLSFLQPPIWSSVTSQSIFLRPNFKLVYD